MNDLISKANTNAKLWQSQLEGGTVKQVVKERNILGGQFRTIKEPVAHMLRKNLDLEGLKNTRTVFKEHFTNEINRISGALNREAAEVMQSIGQDGLDSIINDIFKPLEEKLQDGKKLNKEVAIVFMRDANKLALDVVADLRQTIKDQMSNTNGAPQLVKGSNGFNLIRSAPKLENIVLKGGGAKGMGYPGALREMEDAGMLSGLKRVAGTSAGALTAVALSVGQSSENFEKLAKGSGLKDMLSLHKPHLYFSYPELTFKNGISQFNALGLVQKMDQMMNAEVSSFVDSVGEDGLTSIIKDYSDRFSDKKIDVEGAVKRILTLAEKPSTFGSRSDKLVTFNDMKFLSEIAPKKFKEIVLTGWDSDKNSQVYFKAGGKQGDLPVIYAARISMAHPGIAKGVALPEKYGYGTKPLQDGGIGSNLPSEVFYENFDRNLAVGDTWRDRSLQETRSRTAVLVFDEGGKAEQNIYSTKDKDPMTVERQDTWRSRGLEGLVAHTKTRERDKEYDRQKTLASGPNAFIVAHGDLGTKSIFASDERKENALTSASTLMKEQIDLRYGQAYAVTVDNLAQAFEMLTESELNAFYLQGPPNPQGMTDENFTCASQLFDLVSHEMQNPNRVPRD